MTKIPFSAVTVISVTLRFILISLFCSPAFIHGLGSGATVAVSYGTGTVCGIVADEPNQRIECYRGGKIVAVEPNTSFSSISGGRSFFCGLRSGGYTLLCWDTTSVVSGNFTFRRVYYSDTVLLENLSVGDDQVCATVTNSGEVKCWRSGINWQNSPSGSEKFTSISSGLGFTCGIMKNTSRVKCWGDSVISSSIEGQFGNNTMSTIVAGGAHVCGLNTTGSLLCKGDNRFTQLNLPVANADSPFEFSRLALGANHSCAIRGTNGTVVCWGGDDSEFSMNASNLNGNVSFELIVSGLNYTCGLTTGNYSIICWGPGWPNNPGFTDLPLAKILPGPCVKISCQCGIYGLSSSLCYGTGSICKPCGSGPDHTPPLPPPPQTPPSVSSPPPISKALSKGLLVFAIVGSIGVVSGICTIVYCLWTGVCCGHKKIHNSVQPTITGAGGGGANVALTSNSSPISRSSTIRRQCSRVMRRQRSGTSSKHADKAEEFSLAELVAATDNFSLDNKLGAGSFGVVYKGKLSDGREVAIKRCESVPKSKIFQDKESAFDSELAFLSRLHHKHLVRLVGYCEENDEMLLVYDFMKNGALYDHIHDINNVEKKTSYINSWKVRIRIALDAARGIEYLHNYAVPPIIHRDIKSSNILLDSNWVARVSDFGLSLLSPESNTEFRDMKAAGTVGYIDPEYYGLNVLTAKSDVYGLGVVLLELLTGKRAIFKEGGVDGSPISLVDFAVPAIMAGELSKVLDYRAGRPELNESEAVELVAYTAMHCVNLEGKDRPTMTDIVANLERALLLCEHDSHGSISSGNNSIVSE